MRASSASLSTRSRRVIRTSAPRMDRCRSRAGLTRRILVDVPAARAGIGSTSGRRSPSKIKSPVRMEGRASVRRRELSAAPSLLDENGKRVRQKTIGRRPKSRSPSTKRGRPHRAEHVFIARELQEARKLSFQGFAPTFVCGVREGRRYKASAGPSRTRSWRATPSSPRQRCSKTDLRPLRQR